MMPLIMYAITVWHGNDDQDDIILNSGNRELLPIKF
jgi:hypothetical protein